MVGKNAAADRAPAPPRPRAGAVIWSCVLGLLLLVGLLMPLPGSSAGAWAWELPGLPTAGSRTGSPRPLPPSAPGGKLQEQAPPLAVQQLQEALAERLPQVEIVSPRDGALLGDGPWELKARVSDWPLADAGPLGLGAHLVVQIDDLPPLQLSGDPEALKMQAPALAPGSHRITVYAAKPWGEAVKSPGAIRQIRVHRIAANPLGLPEPGTPQLVPVRPTGEVSGEPVLLDWIVLDAPLQNLRPGDGSWRLRVSINGDSFLLDQNVPLWLQGWRPGSNSLLLELVDGLGEPLNPPFNSRVMEVTLAGGATAQGSKPRWLKGRLSDQELGLLLGEIPLSTLDQAQPPEPVQEQKPAVEQEAAQEQNTNPDPSSPAALKAAAPREPAAAPSAPAPSLPPSNDVTAESAAMSEGERQTPSQSQSARQGDVPSPSDADTEVDTTTDSNTDNDNDNEQAAGETHAAPEASAASGPSPEASPTSSNPPASSPGSPAPETPVPAATPAAPAERISSSTSLQGSARELVNPDGSLIKPRPSGPLAGLRQQLSR